MQQNTPAPIAEAYQHIPDSESMSRLQRFLFNWQLVLHFRLPCALAPKPKSPDEQQETTALQTGDKTGKTKFTPYNDFDSVQELAALGTTVPLVYAAGNPGVRVNTQLLWSNIATVRNGQVAKLLFLSRRES